MVARDHVLIVGFGINGKTLARALRELNIPYQVIESNASTFEKLSHREPIHFGDGARAEILESAGLSSARLVVVTINDSLWIHKIVSQVQRVRPDIEIIVRLQYFLDADKVKDLNGIEPVIAEAETARKIVRKVLGLYEVPQEEIEAILS
jgi:CPA2 family monovalent cation:H+ antiporter-2